MKGIKKAPQVTPLWGSNLAFLLSFSINGISLD
ncbi:hypothetical protein YPC_3308 [Yersinia pestis biovar Medievalis str. Harbin 35]|nr:hypothetical protein YPC_3308 [Yersinia pestis biovar Medievalis str. Harbin 35]EEO77475.1 hypothetical protein YP516_1144 [Yersinia pestis Nepal516]EEO79942.1 hypothetical protein YPF_3368 [Yersinia pestis biovar Orientalis str. India 195]EEO84771.1 hypothetical protein YPH_0592 [Yersinia pestis biovar Orientalis str. PEXU2]EEO88859.1 hypothetical protein YPS_3710 [Yersinia pestis Pestoides A]